MADFTLSHKCNTCKVSYEGIEEIKEHYRGDWHVFNSKRRAHGLAPLVEKDFNKVGRKASAKPKIADGTANGNKSLLSSSSSLSVVSSNNNSSVNNRPMKGKPIITSSSSNSSGIAQKVKEYAQEIGLGPERIEKIEQLTISNEDNSDSDNDDNDNEIDNESVATESTSPMMQPQPVAPTISIFDDKKFDTVAECVDYMAIKYGFFIPDIEYMIDLEGFLTYLGEKVKLGGYCLYCQKHLFPGRPCQNHMISKSHCKIAYEEGVDLEEFEDFYDFTSSYAEMGMGEEDDEEDEDKPEIHVNDIGELVLLDGRTVGHRAFALYYKQRHRPPETRPSILAVQREKLLAMGMSVKDGNFDRISSQELVKMSDMEVMSALVKYHKAVRKGQIIEQRGQMRRAFIDQRRENRSKVDKARSAVSKTEIIRDYHGMLT